MKIYALKNRMTDERDIEHFLRRTPGLFIESKLVIINDYYIERIIGGNMLYYIHKKENKIIKICIYEKTQRGGRK